MASLAGYVWYLRADNDRLREDRKTLTITVEQQKRAMDQLKEDVEDVIKANKEVEQEKEKVRKEHKKLKDTLNRDNKKKKSLEELAIKATSKIEYRVNKATREVFECFELITRGGDC